MHAGDGCSVGKNVRLHGSLKEFGTNVVSMDFDGAAGEISKEWSQKIMVNKDGSFDFSFDLKKYLIQKILILRWFRRHQ